MGAYKVKYLNVEEVIISPLFRITPPKFGHLALGGL